jgi:NhaP-type Na+/H+ or K+/H+ antiporter
MFITWCLIVGVLLIVIGLTDTLRQELPVSAAALYLLAGYLLGPEVYGLLNLRLADDARLLERVSEGAVLISLFAVGLRLRAPLGDRLWRTPLLMASVAMVLTIGMLVGIGVGLGLSLGGAVLLAAVLAPTDPVLASEVQVQHSLDRERFEHPHGCQRVRDVGVRVADDADPHFAAPRVPAHDVARLQRRCQQLVD